MTVGRILRGSVSLLFALIEGEPSEVTEGAELPQCPLWVKKQTCASQNSMSALLPIATVKAGSSRKRSCPLYPRKRTCAVQLGMSALCQKRTLLALMKDNETSPMGQKRRGLKFSFCPLQ